MSRGCRTGKVMLSRVNADRLLLNPHTIRIYKCPFCRWWHRTSQNKRR